MPPSKKASKASTAPSTPASIALFVLTAYFSNTLVLLPLLLTSHQSLLLHPLFSAAPTDVLTKPFHIVLSLLALGTWALVPAIRDLSWRTWWLVLGGSLVCSEGIVRLGATRFMELGLYGGVWAARVAVEAVPTLARWGWVLRVVFCEKRLLLRDAFLFVACVGVVVGPSWQPLLGRLPDCYVLQGYGLLLVVLALFWPDIAYSASNPSAPHESFQIAYALPFAKRKRFSFLAFFLLLSYATSLTSAHCPTSTLRPFPLSTPATSRILESARGPTGWIVVGEEESRGHWFRYLRADHSMLGGLWMGPSRDAVIRGMTERGVGPFTPIDEQEVVWTAESIFSTFILQEVVRLVIRPGWLNERRERALIIGLGAGLSTRAFHLHGVNQTIVEIDPVVYDYARKYFGVPEPMGGVALEDARSFLRKKSDVRYDFVVHDVFTGGTVPSSLFTLEAWAAIKSVLTSSGVVAVNFAGNIKSRASHLVLSTLLASFTHCRAFEDGPPHSDFRNIIIFCSDTGPLQFRKPVKNDYLPYPSPAIRQRVLETFDQFEIDLRGTNRIEFVSDRTVGRLEEAQLNGAYEHWAMMKLVLPDEAWALY